MKTFKIIFGVLILYGAGTEYINAGNQLSTYFSPGILLGSLIMISLAAWLIGSGISKENLVFRSLQYLKYFLIAVVAFGIFALISLKSFKPAPDMVSSNGIKVDIAAFMNGSRKMMPDEQERREYCICVVNRLTGNASIANRFAADLQHGDIDKVVEIVKAEPGFANLNLNECMSSVKHFNWTTTFEHSTREALYQQLKNSDLAKTNNIDVYCDCLIQEYKKLPLNEIASPEFPQSQNFSRIDSMCSVKSKLKQQ